MEQRYKPIFIAGYARSGTTLLHALICTSPDTNPFVKECSWLTKLIEAYAHGHATFHVHTNGYFKTLDDFTSYNVTLINGVLSDFWTGFRKPRTLVLKDPELLAVAPETCELIPDATLAVLVRDVRDVAASQVVRIRKQRNDPGWYDSGYVHEQANRYARLYGRLIDSAPALAGRVVCIRYETLVRETPFSELESLLGISGLDAPSLWRRSDFDITDFKNDEAYSKLFGTAISASNIGRYLPILTEEDASGIERVMQDAEKLFTLYPNIS
nr:sulfotransferase [Fundidesulfovibrio terrae]